MEPSSSEKHNLTRVTILTPQCYPSLSMKILVRLLATILLLFVIASLAIPPIVENRFNKTLEHAPYHPSSAATALHKKLILADLHGDSLLWNRSLLNRSSRGHIDLPR